MTYLCQKRKKNGGSPTSFSRAQAWKITLNLENRASLANRATKSVSPKIILLNLWSEMFSAKYCLSRPIKVPLWSEISLPFFLEILKVCLLNTWLAKYWPLISIQKLFTLSVNFGFHDPPLLTFKPDRLDLRGLDPGKVTSKAHHLKISARERSLLYMQSASLKVWKPKTPVLHINSVAYTRIAFLN